MSISFERFKNLILDGLRPLYNKSDSSLVNKVVSTVSNSLANVAQQVENLQDQLLLRSATGEALIRWGRTFGIEQKDNEDQETFRMRLFDSYDRLYITPSNIRKYILQDYSGEISFSEYFIDRWWLGGKYFPNPIREIKNHLSGNEIEVTYPIFPKTNPDIFSVLEQRRSVLGETSIRQQVFQDVFKTISIEVKRTDQDIFNLIDFEISSWSESFSEYFVELDLFVNEKLVDKRFFSWNPQPQFYKEINTNFNRETHPNKVVYQWFTRDEIRVEFILRNNLGPTTVSSVATLTATATGDREEAEGFIVNSFENNMSTGDLITRQVDSVRANFGSVIENPILRIERPSEDVFYFKVQEFIDDTFVNIQDVYFAQTPFEQELPLIARQIPNNSQYKIVIDAYHDSQLIKNISEYTLQKNITAEKVLQHLPQFSCNFSGQYLVDSTLSRFSIFINTFPIEFANDYVIQIRRAIGTPENIGGFQTLETIHFVDAGNSFAFYSNDTAFVENDIVTYEIVLARAGNLTLVTEPLIGRIQFKIVEDKSDPERQVFQVKQISFVTIPRDYREIVRRQFEVTNATYYPQIQDAQGNRLNNPTNYGLRAQIQDNKIITETEPPSGELSVVYTPNEFGLTGEMQDYDWRPLGFLGYNAYIVQRSIQNNFILEEQGIQNIKVTVDSAPGSKIYCFYNDPNGEKFYAWSAIVNQDGFIFLSDQNRSDNIINDEFHFTNEPNLVSVNFDIANLFSIYSTEDIERKNNFATGASFRGQRITTVNMPRNIGVNVSYQRYPILDYRQLRFENIMRSAENEFKFTFEFQFSAEFKKYNEFLYNEGKYGDLGGTSIEEMVDKVNEAKPAGVKSVLFLRSQDRIAYTVPLLDLAKQQFIFVDKNTGQVLQDPNGDYKLYRGLNINTLVSGPRTFNEIATVHVPQFLTRSKEIIAVLFAGELWEIDLEGYVLGQVEPQFVQLFPNIFDPLGLVQVVFYTAHRIVSDDSEIVWFIGGTDLTLTLPDEVS